jgi:hypothetical protein
MPAASAEARVPSDCRGQCSLAGGVAGFRAGFIPALAGPKHDPEKWDPVFGKDHAQTNRSS